MDECEEIIKKIFEERSKLIGTKKLCYGCLQPMAKEHNAKNCKQRLAWNSHPTVLHGCTKKVRIDTSTSVKSDIKNPPPCRSIYLSHEVLNMCILSIDMYCDKTKSQVQTYAMLDNCSQGTFVKRKSNKWFQNVRNTTSITVKTLNGEETVKTKVIKGLKVAQIGNEHKKCWIDLPKCFTRDSFPADSEEIVAADRIKKWEYLDCNKYSQ